MKNESKNTEDERSQIQRCWQIIVSALILVSSLYLVLVFLILTRALLGRSEFAIQALQTLTSWPVAVFALVFAAFLLFRNPISAWILSIRRVKFHGAEFEALHQQTSTSRMEYPLKAQASDGESRRWLLERFSPDERAKLEGLNEEGARLINDRLLKNDLALLFERAWSQIFGTQIRLLETLLRNNGTVSRGQARQFLLGHRLLVAQSNTIMKELVANLPEDQHFQQYLGWLRSMGLITYDDDQVRSTQLTEPFLKYIADQNYNVLTRQF